MPAGRLFDALESRASTRRLFVAGAQARQDVALIQRVDQAVPVLVRGVAVGIARTHWAAEAAEPESAVQRIHGSVTVGVSGANLG